jgi:hypothetical protein
MADQAPLGDPVAPPPAPTQAADDWIRKALAIGMIVQFTAYIVLVTHIVLFLGKDVSTTANNLIMIILTAEVGYMWQTFNYYYGSSSGSTQKSAILEGKKP